MKIIRALIFSLTLSALFINSAPAAHDYIRSKHSGVYPIYPKVHYGSGQRAIVIKRGEYLTKLGDCIACHTAPGGTPFAGGFPIKTPFGTIYAPNITPDEKHGIGKWKNEQFIKAMREGINPKGQYYYPAFPYLFFNRITTKDLLAIRAYLNSIPASTNPNKANTMAWPFNWRFSQLGWRILFFSTQKTGVYKPNPNKPELWNRGAYLVKGLGHCGMCHTPSYYLFTPKYSLAAPANQYFLAGNMVEGFFAPNITSKLMAHASMKEIKAVFKKDKLIGGGMVQGPMLEANHDSLMYLNNDDIKAIAFFLKTTKSKSPPKKTHGTGLAAGKAVYQQYCIGCHATGAGGAPKTGDATAWEKRINLGMPALYKNAINGVGAMPPKGTCMTCSDKDIDNAVDYIVSISKPGVGSASKPAAEPVKVLSLEDGKNIYTKYCAACHNPSTDYLNAPKLGDKTQWKPILEKGMDTIIFNTIRGYGNMPMRGGCTKCDDAQIKAAVKYMAEQGSEGKNYRLW